jgi:hypothetical protein
MTSPLLDGLMDLCPSRTPLFFHAQTPLIPNIFNFFLQGVKSNPREKRKKKKFFFRRGVEAAMVGYHWKGCGTKSAGN